MSTGVLDTDTFAADSNCVIENGVLKEYTGDGRDIVITNSVTTIGVSDEVFKGLCV